MKKVIEKLKTFINYFFIGFSFLGNQKIVAILTICLFISLLNVSTGYREEILSKEQEMIYEKVDSEVIYYNSSSNDSTKKSLPAASQVVKCLENGLEGEIPSSIQNKIDKLQELYQQKDEYFSFLYQDLFTGFTVSYNEDSPIFTASTIKAPAMIYLYEEASNNKIDLQEQLVYTGAFYSNGSGVLKTKELNTKYTIEELIDYAIHDSDNIAYAMLMNRFQRTNILPFWQNLGTKYIYTLDTIWGVTSAKDASIYMKELYRFYLENDTYGEKLMSKFQNAEWKLITNKEGEFQTANKGGWSGTAIHDVAIVFEENPYILIIMSNTGQSDYSYLFHETSQLVGELHEEYWHYKEESCQTIKQY